MSLQRFIDAQESTFGTALNEICSGRKKSHWMWFVFPQLKGLGHSNMAQFYGIVNLDEAIEYQKHPILGQRLRTITEALITQPQHDASGIFGSPDDLKLKSCLTLFATASPHSDSVFHTALQLYFNGEKDSRTLDFLGVN